MEDSTLKRFGVSMEGSLLRKFDHLVQQQGYENRSEAVRDLVREAILHQTWEDGDQEIAGSIILFYDHHQRNLLDEMTVIQHDVHHLILATMHFHVNHDSCLEIIVVRGKAKEVQALSHQLTSLKGVTYGNFTVAPVEQI
ncbi:nickel-responsive transcriptional regulator NikR [Sporosarcina sp. HYO08]|uniref:nickel-responsive transcriptional regulator NikR n=1 Tax=Sporosarcina sp. HYO08 TaxID=1759557 RepID=UPI000796BB99|nr:nickel-responsive transcriptional regulator NikR [Sporosarcina sp. HYO08]KXH87108.1 nickel-responsive regulator [Sporosarcina sp. HYO08]